MKNSRGAEPVGPDATPSWLGRAGFLDASYVQLQNADSKRQKVDPTPTDTGFDVKRVYLSSGDPFQEGLVGESHGGRAVWRALPARAASL
jgi:hypothetical protein